MTKSKNQSREDISIVYTSKSPLSRGFSFFREVFVNSSHIWLLAKKLALRDISSLYRQTLLGYVWALAPAVVSSATFVLLNRASVLAIDSGEVPYPLFVFSGIILWQFFSDAINSPISMVNANKAMIAKINFQAEALIIAGVAQIMFKFFIKFVLLILMCFYFDVSLDVSFVLVFPAIFGILVFGVFIGLLLVPIGVLFQDVAQIVAILLTAMMFLSPVIYPAPEVGFLSILNSYNPMAYFMACFRGGLLGASYNELAQTFILIGSALFLLFLTFIAYRISLPNLIERMEA